MISLSYEDGQRLVAGPPRKPVKECFHTLIDLLFGRSIILLSTVIDHRRTGYCGLGVGLGIEEVGVKRQAALWRWGRRCHAMDNSEGWALPDRVDILLAGVAHRSLVWRRLVAVELWRDWKIIASWYKADRWELELHHGGAEPVRISLPPSFARLEHKTNTTSFERILLAFFTGLPDVICYISLSICFN